MNSGSSVATTQSCRPVQQARAADAANAAPQQRLVYFQRVLPAKVREGIAARLTRRPLVRLITTWG